MIRILYIYDNPHDRELVRDELVKEHGGFELIEAASRAQFEARLADGGYDLVLSDFNSLGFHGLQVIDAVHALDPQIPVVIVIGTGPEDVGIEALKRGAADYVIKSWTHIRHLPQTIATVLENIRIEKERKRLDESLRESEATYRALFEQAAVGVAQIQSSTGRFEKINQRYCEIVGYTAEEMQRLTFQEITHPDDLQTDLDNMDRLHRGEITDFSMEKRYFRKDGTTVWVNLTVSAPWNFGGTSAFHTAVVQDITQRKLAEELQRASDARYQTLFDNVPDGVFVTDSAGNFTDVNAGALSMLGYARDELIGLNISAVALESEATRVKPEVTEVLAGHHYHREWQGKHRNGSVFLNEVLGARLPNGRAIGIVRDITQRKQAEEALRARNQELERLHEISQAILLSTDLNTLAAALLEKAVVLSDCDLGLIRLVDPVTGRLQPIASHGYLDGKNLLRHHTAMTNTISQRLADTFSLKRTFVVEDVQGDPGFRTFKREGIQSFISVPAQAHEEVLGLVQLGSRTRRTFDPALVRFLETVGSNFGIAVQKNRLLEATSAAQVQLRNLSHRLVEAQEAERHHLARELHDEIGSLLTGLKLTLAANTETSEQAIPIVETALARARSLAQDLRPPMLDDFGLLATLAWHLKEFTARTGVKVDFQHDGAERRFAREIELSAYRIVQEALTNVARHAQVNRVMVTVSADRSNLHIEVADQGVGFDQPTIPAQVEHIGLVGLRERTAFVGGRIEITSAPGAGTRIVLEIPLDGEQ